MYSASIAKAIWGHPCLLSVKGQFKTWSLDMNGKNSLAKKLSLTHVLPHTKPNSLNANCTEPQY